MKSIKMNIATSTIRYVLFALNFSIVVVGLCLVGFGVETLVNNDSTKILENNDHTTIGYLLIFIGLCIYGVTIFGCWGVLYEKYSMLYICGVLLAALLVLQCIFYGLTLSFKHETEMFIKKEAETFFMQYNSPKNNQTNITIFDYIQRTYSCCGVTGPEFWNKKFPPSCCDTDSKKCYDKNVYQNGCLDVIKEKIATKFLLLYLFIAIAIQIFVLFSTFYLATNLRTRRTSYQII